MPDRAFSTEDALRTGWNLTMANLRPLLGLGAVSAVLALLQSALREPGGGPPGLRGLFSLAINVVQVGLSMVWIRTALRLREGRPPDLAQWRDVLPRFWSYLLASVLVGLVVAVGLVLLVVPGVIWGLRFGFAGFAVMERGLDPLEAMRESRRLTDGVKGQVLVFALALLGVNLLGALALGVGLLVTIPTSFLAAAEVYQRLRSRAGQRVGPPEQPRVGLPIEGHA
jgi:uncharacterized membrane protein